MEEQSGGGVKVVVNGPKLVELNDILTNANASSKSVTRNAVLVEVVSCWGSLPHRGGAVGICSVCHSSTDLHQGQRRHHTLPLAACQCYGPREANPVICSARGVCSFGSEGRPGLSRAVYLACLSSGDVPTHTHSRRWLIRSCLISVRRLQSAL